MAEEMSRQSVGKVLTSFPWALRYCIIVLWLNSNYIICGDIKYAFDFTGQRCSKAGPGALGPGAGA